MISFPSSGVSGFFYLLVWLAAPAPHPDHSSLAEIGWNEARDTLQVALRVIPEDLESALTFRLKKTFVLAESERVDQVLLEYLFDNFIVTRSQGKQLPMNFIGKQVKHDGAWLFFEIPSEGAASLKLENRVLCDLEETQINRVVFTAAPGQQKTLRFTCATARQQLWP